MQQYRNHNPKLEAFDTLIVQKESVQKALPQKNSYRPTCACKENTRVNELPRAPTMSTHTRTYHNRNYTL